MAAIPHGGKPSNPDLRRKVLQQLADYPETRYAVVVDDADTDPVIVGFGIRGAATCDLAIPKARFDPAELQRAIKDMAGAEMSTDLSRAVGKTVEIFMGFNDWREYELNPDADMSMTGTPSAKVQPVPISRRLNRRSRN